jgi:hypothetical protein
MMPNPHVRTIEVVGGTRHRSHFFFAVNAELPREWRVAFYQVLTHLGDELVPTFDVDVEIYDLTMISVANGKMPRARWLGYVLRGYWT